MSRDTNTWTQVALGLIALVVVASLVLGAVIIAKPMLDRFLRHKDDD